MKKGGLSIRYKVLILLSIMPLLALGAYLYLALGIFQKDKLAYVFDSSRSLSVSLASQVRTSVQSAQEKIRAIGQGFNYITGQMNPYSTRIFTQDPNLSSMLFLLPEADGYKLSDILEKEKGGSQAFRYGTLFFDSLMEQIKRDGVVLQLVAGEDLLLFGTRFQHSEGSQAHFLVFSLLRVEDLNRSFRDESVYSNYLIRSNGEILFGPMTETFSNIKEKLPTEFLATARSKRQPSGVRKVSDKLGTEYLASFSQVGLGGLSVVSVVPQAQALQAVQLLVRKSVLFFVALISLTGIISLYASKGLTFALLKLNEATSRIAKGHFDERVRVSSRDEVGELAEGFNFMTSEVQRLLSETAEKARMESELQTAHMVQETLFPEPHVELGGLDICGHYQPASECGGDWFHYSVVDEKVYLWIGDATGHGAPAALITSAAKSAASIIESLKVSPGYAMALLNQAIFSVAKGKLMMTFFLASYDPKTGKLTYVNASHEPAFLLKKKSGQYKKRDLITLNETNGPRLGHHFDSTYPEVTIDMEEGDKLFFYTDGIPDLHSPDGAQWGERSFIKALLHAINEGQGSVQSAELLEAEIAGHRQDSHLADDVTFIFCERTTENT